MIDPNYSEEKGMSYEDYLSSLNQKDPDCPYRYAHCSGVKCPKKVYCLKSCRSN